MSPLQISDNYRRISQRPIAVTKCRNFSERADFAVLRIRPERNDGVVLVGDSFFGQCDDGFRTNGDPRVPYSVGMISLLDRNCGGSALREI